MSAETTTLVASNLAMSDSDSGGSQSSSTSSTQAESSETLENPEALTDTGMTELGPATDGPVQKCQVHMCTKPVTKDSEQWCTKHVARVCIEKGCDEPAVGRILRCEVHAAQQRAWQARARAAKAARGECDSCHRPRDGSAKSCSFCALARKQRWTKAKQQARRAINACVHCALPAAGGSQYRAVHKGSGGGEGDGTSSISTPCVKCPLPRADGFRMCAEHVAAARGRLLQCRMAWVKRQQLVVKKA